MYYFIFSLICSFIYIIYIELGIYDLHTFNIFNLFTKRNAIATLHKNVHYQMIDLLHKHINTRDVYHLLEIGAGNGNSSYNFITALQHLQNYTFYYTINEYYKSYLHKLTTNLDKVKDHKHIIINKNIFIMPFESIHLYNSSRKYDIILLTAISSINDTNIHHLKKISHDKTIIITICPYIFQYILVKYFKIIEVNNLSILLGLYCLKI